MLQDEKKKLKTEIVLSSITILLVATIIVLIEHCYPTLINIKSSTTNSLVLRVIIQTIGLFLGFIVTSITMKFNQLDNVIQKIAEDINTIINGSSNYRNVTLSQSDITTKFKTHISTLTNKDKENGLLKNYTYMCKFRSYHKRWLTYPIVYSLITIGLTFILLIFHQTISTLDYIYTALFSLCSLMTIWTVYTNISFVISFFDNPFTENEK